MKKYRCFGDEFEPLIDEADDGEFYMVKHVDERIADLEQASREGWRYSEEVKEEFTARGQQITELKRDVARYENGRVVLLAEIESRNRRLAMAEDAANKGDLARANADAMQQRIHELEAQNLKLLQDSLERDVLVEVLAKHALVTDASADWFQAYMFDNHGQKYSRENAQQVLTAAITHTELNPSETPNSSPQICATCVGIGCFECEGTGFVKATNDE